MILPICGSLMKSHRIRKRRREYTVVYRRHTMKDLAERSRILRSEIVHAAHVPATADERLKRPDSPEGNQGDEPIVLANHSCILALLQSDVITQQAMLMSLPVGALSHQLLGGCFGNRVRCPDLAVRMWIARAHHGSAIFEDLDVVDAFQAAQFAELPAPSVDDRFNFLLIQI